MNRDSEGAERPAPTFDDYRAMVPWIALSQFGQTYNKSVGCVSFEDLTQEGYVALIGAIKTYNSKHSSGAAFTTYAYQAIRKAMAHYLEANSAPVTGGRAFNVKRGNEAMQAQFAMAAKRILLSDLSFEELEAAVIDDTSPETAVDEADWFEYCVGRLVEQMAPDELSLLAMNALGASHREISEVLGVSRRQAARIVRQQLIKACGILSEEVDV